MDTIEISNKMDEIVSNHIPSEKYNCVLNDNNDILSINIDKDYLNNQLELVDNIINECYQYKFYIRSIEYLSMDKSSFNIHLFKIIKDVPPEYLYHGTSPDFIDSISINGLEKMKSNYVYLSNDINRAKHLGKRHSNQKEPVVLTVKSNEMYNNGFIFYKTDDNVWLIDSIPLEYIIF